MGEQQGGLQKGKFSVEAGDFLYVHAMAGPQVTQLRDPGPAATHGAQHRLQELCTNTCNKSWGNSCFLNFKFALFWYSQKLVKIFLGFFQCAKTL